MKKEWEKLGLTAGLSLACGMVLGSGLALMINKAKTKSASDVLEAIKLSFSEEGPIEGAWIQMKKEELRRYAIKTKVYTGGITRREDELLVQYEFIADAYTGTVIDIYRLN